jgi:hypothetical protein
MYKLKKTKIIRSCNYLVIVAQATELILSIVAITDLFISSLSVKEKK